MIGPRVDRELIDGLTRGLVAILETQAGLLTALRESVRATTPPKALRTALAATRATLRLTALVERRPPATPDDDPPETVRVDAELRAQARALREQAEPLAADLTRRLSTTRARRGAILALNRRAAGSPRQ